jgi:hypothetical protein
VAHLLDVGKGSVQRAIEVHRTDWEELKKALGETQ